ncbi:MAG: hypothetical protein JAY66_28240 [Candidatus Thiodiazotropha taylori]|nr:hypothetical protein [Candidatus Thiodiazotropha taylori]
MTDSKGRYLQGVQHALVLPNIPIQFLGRSGLRLAQGLNLLKDNIHGIIKSASFTHLYVWLGTCDLTTKAADHSLHLRNRNDDDCYRYVFTQIQRFYQLTAHYKEVKLVFLQIPPYSIVRWHENKCRPVTQGNKQDDLILFRRICYINEFIDTINDSHMVSSVRFKLDLFQEKKTRNRKGRKSVTYSHYLDGIHPNNQLSMVWLKRIVERAFIN